MSNKISKLKLFLTMFQLSLFTFGGGYVIVSLMKKKFVDELKLLEQDDMLNLIAIAQSSPGAVAVNGSILVGYRIAGFSGALISMFATILPPFIIITTISFFYTAFKSNLVIAAVLKAMQAAIAAIIIDVVLNLGGNVAKSKSFVSIIVMIVAFIATYFLNLNIVLILLVSAMVGIIQYKGVLR